MFNFTLVLLLLHNDSILFMVIKLLLKYLTLAKIDRSQLKKKE